MCIFSQIMYNVSKPFSYEKSGLKNITEIPLIHFPVNNDGNLIEQNLKLNIKEKAVNEIIDNKFVTRMKVKVFAEKLGMMTLILDNVKLNNNSYCYVYTPDYKIVAGPIYQGSIDKYLIIKEIPTDELIIEVISNFASDFDLTINEVDYLSLYKSKMNDSKKSEQLLSGGDSCHTCNNGEKSYANFIDEVNDCGWLGYGNGNEIFELENLKGVNNYQLNAARSACVIMIPQCNIVANYGGENGTLMNFPYEDCQDSNNCGQGFVFTAYHLGAIQDIIKADSIIKSSSVGLEDSIHYLDFLNKVLIRFNWHHEFGTPWNLENVNCTASQYNFEQWRQSIDFTEVIDYCGVRAFAYQKEDDGLVILKMVQKPFYKEHHLGWTAQGNFDTEKYEDSSPEGNNDWKALNPKDFKILGRRAIKPASIFENYNTYFQTYKQDKENYQVLRFHVANIQDTSFSFSGFSGSQLTLRDIVDSNQVIGLGMVFWSLRIDTMFNFVGKSYYSLLYALDGGYYFKDECINSTNKQRMSTFYLNTFPTSVIDSTPYLHYYGTDTLTTYRKWMPSLNNKQKCPSQIAVQDSCNFDISNYITCNDSTKCITFDSIPANLFPGGELPKGYRIYYNDGEQKTLHYDSYNDNLPIVLDYAHCFTSCELFDLFMQGKDSLNIAIDFYDSFGRILNNIGCENIEFKAAISFNLCSMFEITAEKTQSDSNCCTYTFTVSVKDGCAKNKPFLRKIANTLKLLNSPEDDGIPLSSIPGLTYNYIDGKITFSRQLCDSNSTDRFLFAYDEGNIVCNSPEIKPESCFCACPAPDISKDWITVTTTQGGLGESCPEGSCKVTINIDIPPFYNCFKFFKMGSMNRSITNGKATYSFCIPAGTARTDTILIKKNLGDQEPCIIIKHSYCPILSQPKFCKSGCDSVDWDERTLVDIPLPGCPNCFINAKYMTRTNPCEDPRKQELQVTEIEVYNSLGDTLACGPCLGNMAEIHKLVLLKAIHKNEMGFDPILDDNLDSLCDETWRVSIASCWAEYSSKFELTAGDIDYKPKKRYVPCDTVCCSVGLRVCRYKGQPDYITIDTIQGDTNPNLCNADSLFIYDPHIGGFGGGNPIGDPSGGSSSASYIVAGYNVPCINRCDWLDILTSEAYYGKRATPNEPTNNILVKNECRLLTYLYEESMNCIFDSDVNSNDFSISIYSINGELLLKENQNVTKGYNEFTINLKNINSGIYLIQAELNGICSKTDKLIIVK